MKVSFIIPFHNEEKNAGPMLEQLITIGEKKGWTVEIIPVNDKSSDTTGKILDAYGKKYKSIHPVHRKKNSEEMGNTMGKALCEGTLKAKGDIVIWTMGDRSDESSTYAKIINQISSGYDIVFASRYMRGGSKGNLDNLKAFLSQWGTNLARCMFGVPVHDITNAFRGFKREVFIKVKPSAPDFAVSPEFAIRAYMSGYRLGEVPTVYHNRTEGISNFKLFKMTRSYLSIYILLFLHYRILKKKT